MREQEKRKAMQKLRRDPKKLETLELYSMLGGGKVSISDDSSDAFLKEVREGLSQGLGNVSTVHGFRVQNLFESMVVSLGKAPRVSPWLTGMVERLFFTVVAAYTLQSAPAAMIAWTGIKMAANWNRLQEPSQTRGLAFTALVAGLVSMFFALIGGLVCSRKLIFTSDLFVKLITGFSNS